MSRSLYMMLLGLALMLASAACSSNEKGESLLLWHAYSGAELEALEEAVAEVERESDLRIRLVGVPYEAFADKLTAAIPNGNGPDLFIFAHDRIGHWTANQLIEPIEFYVDDSIADRFAYEAVAAMSYDESLYGLPLAVKSVALFYRPDLLSRAPTETRELFAMESLYKGKAPSYPLVYENTNLYPHAAWLHGFGAPLFDEEGRNDVASSEAVAALTFARRLDREGVVPGGVDSRMVATLFNEGKAAMAISGPWFQNDIKKGIPWAVATMPVVSETGLPAKPFLGVEGILMSSRSTNKDRAFQALEMLTRDASAISRARTAKQVVPNLSAYEDPDLASNSALMTFRAQLDSTVPMSASPEMRSVWTPYQSALMKVIDQNTDAADALRAAEAEILSYTRGAK
jgi:maltose-binding protein MalE